MLLQFDRESNELPPEGRKTNANGEWRVGSEEWRVGSGEWRRETERHATG